MTRQMKKAVYEAPLTEHFQVELEGVFCGSVEIKEGNSGNGINDQTINTGFESSANNGGEFISGSWE